jgi:hypothetical protein
MKNYNQELKINLSSSWHERKIDMKRKNKISLFLNKLQLNEHDKKGRSLCHPFFHQNYSNYKYEWISTWHKIILISSHLET